VLVYSTYLSGSSFGSDVGLDIAVDTAGNAYITGETSSADFPTTHGALQRTFRVGQDGFVSKLNSTGTALLYSTFLGGGNINSGSGIAVDAAGNAYVMGYTDSADFPTTTGAFQPQFRGGFLDAFVSKLNATGTALVYSTYLGGSGVEEGFRIAVDAAGDAYVTGYTFGTSDFPTTPGTFQPAFGGVFDAFVSKLNPTPTALVYSTFLGGSNFDSGGDIAVDRAGHAYVTGRTDSPDFPTTPGAFQPTRRGDFDAFVARILEVTYASVCALSRQVVTNATLAQGMCAALEAAERSERLGSAQGKAAALRAYRQLIEAAQRSGSLSAQDAALLLRLAEEL
jgi:Beta-propeller repeat